MFKMVPPPPPKGCVSTIRMAMGLVEVRIEEFVFSCVLGLLLIDLWI